jgi:hypothetical protein
MAAKLKYKNIDHINGKTLPNVSHHPQPPPFLLVPTFNLKWNKNNFLNIFCPVHSEDYHWEETAGEVLLHCFVYFCQNPLGLWRKNKTLKTFTISWLELSFSKVSRNVSSPGAQQKENKRGQCYYK